MNKRALMFIVASVVILMAIFASPLPRTTGAQERTDPNGGGKAATARPDTVFTNSAPITINDEDNATPYPSTIDVSGLGTTLTNVKVTLNGFSHTFPDDVGIVVVGPTGAAILLQDGAGDDPDMVNVTYTFADSGATVLPNLTAWGTGEWKPTAYFTGDPFPSPGPGTTYGNPGPAGSGTATFANTFEGTNPNGTWSLYVIDFVAGDSGNISGGWSINVTAGADPITQHTMDFDGNGKTDFVLARNVGGGPSGQLRWFIKSDSGVDTSFDWGLQSDEFVPADYDGDNKTDISVWRPSPALTTNWFILQSNGFTLRQESFGQSGDDPSVVGDYNNDGKDDLAVYRAGATAGAPSTWFYRTAANGAVTYILWGQNGDFPAPGDYDGDGKNDFVVQRNAGGGQARFFFLLGNGTIPATQIWGTPTDVIVPGDYDGDGKTDIATIRGSGGNIQWFIHGSGGTDQSFLVFGNSATDFPAQGDYDGDGKTDVAIWRPSVTPGSSAFWYRTAGGLAISVPYGQNGDYPVGNFNSH